MPSTAVVAVFKTDEENLLKRKRTVVRLAHEIRLKIKAAHRDVVVVLLGGGRLAFPYPDTANFYRVTSLRSSIVVGTYNGASEPERIVEDLEAALSEYFEGRLTSPAGGDHAAG
jgi:hypothetical protein